MATPKHYTSHHMLEAAFKFRKAELWKVLSDGDIFAVTLPSGEIGYCIVMGAGGTYFGLGMYRGSKGFSTYLRMINPPQNQIDAMAATLTYDVINCNFSQANEMNFGIKEPVREFSKKFEIPIPKKKGWPEFVQYKPFRDLAPVGTEQDGDDIATALFAGIYLAKLLKKQTPEELGFDPDGDYPDKKGGKVVPLLVDDGFQEFHLETTTLPAYEEFDYPKPKMLSKEMTNAYKNMQKHGSIEVGTIAMPGLIRSNPENMAPIAIPIIYKENGMLSAVPCEHPYDLEPNDFLYHVLDNITDDDTLPETIICTDELTACMFEDFCKVTGVKLKKSKKSSELTYASFQLYTSMMHGI